jgi:hypothetical protein
MTTDAIAEFELAAKTQGVSWRALLKTRAAAAHITEGQLYEQLVQGSPKSTVVRLLESRRQAQPPLEKAFELLGQNPQQAKIAAAGRAGLRSGIREASSVKDAAGLGPDAYAYAPDPEDPTTWRLQIAKDDPRSDNGTTFDSELVKYAVNHLPGIAMYGQAVDIPEKDLAAVKATLRSAWIACGLSIDDLPIEMQNLELAAALRSLGHTGIGLRAAMRGRSRR